MTKAEVAQKIAKELAEVIPVPTIHILINRALADGNIDAAERLLAMAARRAFNRAVAGAKAEIPVIVKTATGHNNAKYADFASIARVVDPILGRHGLGYRFRTLQTDGVMAVTCVLFHDEGHAEENTLCGPADNTGSKNAIQAIGSTATYLQRYTLVQALGLAASKDDDGNTAGGAEVKVISEKQFRELADLVKASGADIDKFCALLKIESLGLLPLARFDEAVLQLKRKLALARAAAHAKTHGTTR